MCGCVSSKTVVPQTAQTQQTAITATTYMIYADGSQQWSHTFQRASGHTSIGTEMKFCLKHEWITKDGYRTCRLCYKEQAIEFRSGIRTRKYVCFECNSVISQSHCQRGHLAIYVPEFMRVPSPRHEGRWKAFQKELIEFRSNPRTERKSLSARLLEKWVK